MDIVPLDQGIPRCIVGLTDNAANHCQTVGKVRRTADQIGLARAECITQRVKETEYHDQVSLKLGDDDIHHPGGAIALKAECKQAA